MRPNLTRRIAAACLLALALGGAAALAQGLAYHGNVKSRIFHVQGCRYFDCAACSAAFDSREAAIKAGYRPCKVCNP
jgi:methylphosphotriester-DNA--protein-cysteine methyltransferase